MAHKTLYFITGNKNKAEETSSILSVNVKQLEMDLPEIQELDGRKVVEAKIQEALKHRKEGGFIIEDVSFEMDALGGFPGPFVKWMIDAVGTQGLYEIAEKAENFGAEAIATIGYAKNSREVYFFEGRMRGKLAPRVEGHGFAYDKIFIPKGHTKRYSEMTSEEKNKISHRRKALDKLSEFLQKHEQEDGKKK